MVLRTIFSVKGQNYVSQCYERQRQRDRETNYQEELHCCMKLEDMQKVTYTSNIQTQLQVSGEKVQLK